MGPTAWRYLKIRAELVEMMNGVRLNNHRIEELVDQLYGLNRRVIELPVTGSSPLTMPLM